MPRMGRAERTLVNTPHRSRRVAEWSEKMLSGIHFERGDRYLDVGCGNGAAALHLARKFGLEVTGVDVDPEQIRVARESASGEAGVTFLELDGTALPFDDASFHIVATHKVTHHIPDWQRALDEMVRVLRGGGFLIYNDFVLPGWLAGWGRKLAGQRLGFPTAAALESLFERRGLVPIHLDRFAFVFEAVCRRDPSRAETLTGF